MVMLERGLKDYAASRLISAKKMGESQQGI